MLHWFTRRETNTVSRSSITMGVLDARLFPHQVWPSQRVREAAIAVHRGQDLLSPAELGLRFCQSAFLNDYRLRRRLHGVLLLDSKASICTKPVPDVALLESLQRPAGEKPNRICQARINPA